MPEYDSIKVKDQLGRPEDVGFTIKRFTDTVIVEVLSTVVTRQNIGSEVGIYGNPVFGIYGTSKYGGYAQTSFILGNSLAGVLGSSILGSQVSSPELMSVVNVNKVYKEYFRDNYFENSGSSTADWAISSGELSFTNTEIAQSNPVAYADGTIVRATLSMNFSSGSSGLILSELSANGGNNFETVTNNVSHLFTNTGSSLIFRLTSSGTAVITNLNIDYS